MKKTIIILILFFAVSAIAQTVRERPVYRSTEEVSFSGSLGNAYAVIDSSIKRPVGGISSSLKNTHASRSLDYQLVLWYAINATSPDTIATGTLTAGNIVAFNFSNHKIAKFHILGKNTTADSTASFIVESQGVLY